MSWALKRQIIFIIVLLVTLGVIVFFIVAPHIDNIPTCSDGKQNGDETGVDCGGSCSNQCLYEVDQVSILWARAFKVVKGRYNAVAYLENHNPTSAIRNISYRFRFADENNIYIGKREGKTTIPASGKFAVFEPAIDFGNSIPVYVSFEFTETPFWVKAPEEKLNEVKVFVSDLELKNENTDPYLSAVIKNNSLFIIPEVDVVVILYDKDGNAITSSRTYLEQLDRGESKEISFTWPSPFKEKVVASEIIPIYDIFLTKLK